MKINKKHLVTGLIGNLLVFILGLIGIIILFTEKVEFPAVLKYFTTISNFLVVIVSFVNAIVFSVSVAKEKNHVKEGFHIAKLVAVTMCAITFTMVVIFLAPANPSFGWFKGSQLFLHLITPIAAVVSFIFLEYASKMRFRFFFVPAVVVIAYGIFYVLFAAFAPKGESVDWYNFMFEANNRVAPVDFSKFTVGKFFLFLGESLGAALVFGFVLWLFNKIMNLIFVGYVLDEEEAVEEPKEEQKEEAKAKKTATKSPKSKSTPNKKYNGGVRTYHISRSKLVSKQWQVKLAGGEKAIKLFDTQLEAINYAKELTKKQGGSIRIHSMKGQLRK